MRKCKICEAETLTKAVIAWCNKCRKEDPKGYRKAYSKEYNKGRRLTPYGKKMAKEQRERDMEFFHLKQAEYRAKKAKLDAIMKEFM